MRASPDAVMLLGCKLVSSQSADGGSCNATSLNRCHSAHYDLGIVIRWPCPNIGEGGGVVAN